MMIERVLADLPNPDGVIHLDNAGSSPPPTPVLEAMLNHLRLEQRVGGYRAQELSIDQQNLFYTITAKMLGCGVTELAFTDSATRAYDMAIYGIDIRPGQTVLLSPTEYASNHISIIQRCRTVGASWEMMPCKENGVIDTEALSTKLQNHSDIALVTVSHVPTNAGVVQPVEEIGGLTRAAGIPYIVDACQSAGQLVLDVEKIGCDMLSFTGRKFLRGPRGTGVLYVRHEFLDRIEPPMLDLFSASLTARDAYRVRPDCRRFETWEFNVAAKIGLAVAIAYYLEVGAREIQSRVCELATRLTADLRSIKGVSIQDGTPGQCAIVTLTHQSVSALEMHRRLARQGIFSTASGVENSWLDLSKPGGHAVLRLSPHYFLTEPELQRAVKILEQIVTTA